MDFNLLKSEIAKPEYAGLSDLAVAEALNAKRKSVRRAIPAREVKRLWGRRMILAKCWALAQDGTTPISARVLCRATYDNLMGDLFQDLDPDDASQAVDIAAYLDGLVSAGAMAEQDKADTLALATIEVPLFDEYVIPAMVEKARAA